MTLYLARHDIMLLFKDRKTMAILLLMPMILMTILGYSLKSSFESDFLTAPIPVAVVKAYTSESSTNNNYFEAISAALSPEQGLELTRIAKDIDVDALLFEDILESPEMQDVVDVQIMSLAVAEKSLKEGAVEAVLYLPENFERNLGISLSLPFRNETEPRLTLRRESGLKGTIVKQVFEGIFSSFNRKIAAKNIFFEAYALNTNELMDYDVAGDSIEAALSQDETLPTIRTKSLPGIRTVGSMAYYAAAMMSMFLLFTAGQGGRMFLEEKEQFTLQRQLMSGIRIRDCLVSKWLTLIGIAYVQTLGMILYSALILKVDWGNLGIALLIGLCASVAVAGMGVFVGVITYRMGDYKLANMMESLIIQVMAFFGGSFIPLAVLPGFVETLSFLTVNGLMLKSLLRNMQGFGLDSFSMYLFALIIIGILFVGSAMALLRPRKVVEA